MKKCLSLLIALTMILSIVVFPVSTQAETVDIPEGATLIFAEDFEEGFATGNLLSADATEVNITNTATGKKALWFKYNDSTKETVTVEAGPSAFNTSKVLKIDTSYYGDVSSRIYLDGGNDIASPAKSSSPYYGKQIVVEFDVMNAGANGDQDNPFMQLRPSAGTTDTTPMYLGYNSNQLQYRQGSFANASTTDVSKKDWYSAYQPAIGTKSHKVKYVVEQNMTDFDSTRFYFDNALVTRGPSVATDWNTGRIFKDFMKSGNTFDVNGYSAYVKEKGYTASSLRTSLDYGDAGALYSEIKAYWADPDKDGVKTLQKNSTIYIDNIVVYAIDPINFTGLNKDQGVDLEAGVVANFSQPFDGDADTFALSLASDDTKLEGAISEVTMSANKKSATIKFDTTVLGDNKEFKLWVDEGLTSEAGAIYYKDLDGVKEGEEYVELTEFLTYVPFELAEDAPAGVSGLIPNDPRKVEIKTTGTVATVTAELNGAAVDTFYNGTVAGVSFVNVAEPEDGDLNVTITSADGQTINLSIPVTAISDEIDYIYNDGLESMELGKIEVDETQTNDQNGKFALTTSAASLAEAGSVSIVEDAEQGKVLEMKTLSAGHFGVLYDAGETYDTDGKVLVIQTKYKIPENAPSNDGINYGAMNNYASSTTAGRALSLRYTGSTAYISMGKWPSALNNTEDGSTITKGKWIDYTTVVDKSTPATGNDPHTFRFYNNGKLFSASVGKYATEYPDATVIPRVYDWAPASYFGLWDHSAVAPAIGGTSYGVIDMADFRGTYTQIPVAKDLAKVDTYKHSIYIDDFRAFFADKFAITSISENASAFIPTKHTLKVVFNQKVSADQLSEVKLINAATNEALEGWTAVEANGGYALDFTLPAVAAGNTYKLAFTPAFHDITSYQGLSTNNHDFVTEETITIADYTPFTATGYQASFANFEQGRTATTDITLSVATSLVGSNLKDAFDVVNDEGVEVTEGWSATVSEDKKTITLDFTNLATDNYTVTSNDNLVTLDGDKLDGDAVEITITAKVGKIMLFEEDFEDTATFSYTVGDNWLEDGKLPTNGKWKASTTNQKETTKVSVENTIPAEGTKLSGKFLRVVADGDSTSSTFTYVNGLIDEFDESKPEYQNKVIVMETDIYAASLANGVNPMLPSLDGNLTPTSTFMKHDGNGLKYEGAWLSGVVSDAAQNMHTRWKKYITNASGSRLACKNGTMTTVIDQRNAMDTVKVLFDGHQLVEKSNTLLTDHELYQQEIYEVPLRYNGSSMNKYWKENDAGNLQGFVVYGKNQANYGSTDLYLDNIKVYLVDAFEIASVEGATQAFNAKNNVVKFNFTNKVTLDEANANFVLKDADGNVVANGLTLSIEENGYQVVAQLDESKIEGSEEYTIEVSPEIKDEYGQPLAHKYKLYEYKSTGGTGWVTTDTGKTSINGFYATKEAAEAAAGTTKDVYKYTWEMSDAENGIVKNFKANMAEMTDTFDANGYIRDDAKMNILTTLKTTKGTSLYAEATAATVAEKNVTTKLTLTNPEDKALDVWYIVAAYGQYNEMLGCQAAATNVAAGDVEYVDIDFDAKATGIDSVKVYIWDGYKTMVPYQDAETIFGE